MTSIINIKKREREMKVNDRRHIWHLPPRRLSYAESLNRIIYWFNHKSTSANVITWRLRRQSTFHIPLFSHIFQIIFIMQKCFQPKTLRNENENEAKNNNESDKIKIFLIVVIHFFFFCVLFSLLRSSSRIRSAVELDEGR